MTNLDWILMALALASIVFFGVYKGRSNKDIEGFLLGNKSLPWYHVGLSVMATQASAITFLSAPGQGFVHGTSFVQFYFGLPLAMIVLSITFIPIFHRLKVYTAYEFLENRFEPRVRVFTALLFLLSRALATGISIYAPSIILSTIFGWDILVTNVFMGSLVLIYTVTGGAKAISYTHLQQMLFVTFAMFFTGFLIVKMLPSNIGLVKALTIAGQSNRLNTIDLKFNPQEKYNLWSGLIGGFFLQLSYFGTDQSQVGRYLTGSSIKQSRMGLIMNGLIKVPMQFGILIIGVLVYVFYLFNPTPVFFNKVEVAKLEKSQYFKEYAIIKKNNDSLNFLKTDITNKFVNKSNPNYKSEILKIDELQKQNKDAVSQLIKKNNPTADANDVNYIFLRFILDNLPHGFIGLLIAIIFSASMGSVASAYHSLAATTLNDVMAKTKYKPKDKTQELKFSKYLTVFWGLFCILVAAYAQKFGNSMLELVNILGSWFYGIILGIFLVAFYYPKIKGNAIFWGGILAQIAIIVLWKFDSVAYLWLNPIGVFLVFIFSWIIQKFSSKPY